MLHKLMAYFVIILKKEIIFFFTVLYVSETNGENVKSEAVYGQTLLNDQKYKKTAFNLCSCLRMSSKPINSKIKMGIG